MGLGHFLCLETHSAFLALSPPPSLESPSGSPLSKSEVAASTHTALLLGFRAASILHFAPSPQHSAKLQALSPSWPLQTLPPFNAPFHSSASFSSPKTFCPLTPPSVFKSPAWLYHRSPSDPSLKPLVPDTETTTGLLCHLAPSE